VDLQPGGKAAWFSLHHRAADRLIASHDCSRHKAEIGEPSGSTQMRRQPRPHFGIGEGRGASCLSVSTVSRDVVAPAGRAGPLRLPSADVEPAEGLRRARDYSPPFRTSARLAAQQLQPA
jgi:hypothetical protein